jgi:hypothetical protein
MIVVLCYGPNGRRRRVLRAHYALFLASPERYSESHTQSTTSYRQYLIKKEKIGCTCTRGANQYRRPNETRTFSGGQTWVFLPTEPTVYTLVGD